MKQTQNYKLNKPGYEEFGDVETLNENWDKVDEALAASDPTKADTKETPADADGVLLADSEAAGSLKRLSWANVKATLGKLFVPLARKINGKALSGDVTLTGDDIAMGADDAESLRAAMAKRLRSAPGFIDSTSIFDRIVAEYHAGRTAGFINAINAPDLPYEEKNWNYNVFYFYAEYLIAYAFRSFNNNVKPNAGYVRFATFNGWQGDWLPIAVQSAPGVHDMPLLSGITSNRLVYFKNQEGIVTITGSIAATFSAREYIDIGNMPEGFRPISNFEMPVTFSSNGAGNAAISTSGLFRIAAYNDGSRYAYLSLSYPAA